MIYTIEETIEPEDISLDSFKVNNKLNLKFWDADMRLDQHIRKSLLIIAKNFIDYCDLGDYVIDDIVITGSIANYNWNEKYSDIDLHVIMDTKEISEVPSVAKNFCTFAKNLWNKNHTDVSVAGFPVEVYIQDSNEKHHSTGIYSLLYDEWIIKPNIDLLNPNYTKDEVKSSVAHFMNKIDDLVDIEESCDENILYDKACELMDEIKDVRTSDLIGNNKSIELTNGNIIFKTLRRTGYLEKLTDLKNRLIDKILSYY